MNVNELKDKYPARFKQEYDKWAENQCAWDDWWVCVEENFKTDMAPLGLDVEKVWFQLSYSQGDYAKFEGRLSVTQWMKDEGYADTYPALWLAMCDYGFELPVHDSHDRPRIYWEYYYSVGDNTEPSGVFADLPQDAWCELVESQMNAEPWEKLIDDWLEDKAHDLYKQLQTEYEYLTSEEVFIEHCDINDVTFDEPEE